MSSKDLIVMKFGGTSLRDADAFRNCADLIRRSTALYRIVVVVSAVSGVTDLIFGVIQAAQTGDWAARDLHLETLSSIHRGILDNLLDPSESPAAWALAEQLLGRLRHTCSCRSQPHSFSSCERDALAPIGEYISAQILTEHLQATGVKARFVGAERIVVTNASFGNASPEMKATTEKCEEIIRPMLEEGCIPVVTGYVGTTRWGDLTTLGRGGSDYSATIIGAAMHASQVWIWTDVDGILTADPRVCPNAVLIPEISASDAVEMAYYGAKVIHPRALGPALEAPFPIWIRNSFRPADKGTRINGTSTKAGVSAVSFVNPVHLFNIHTGGNGHSEFLACLLTQLEERNIDPLIMTESPAEHAISMVLREADTLGMRQFVLDALGKRESAQSAGGLEIMDDVALVAITGLRHQRRWAPIARLLSNVTNQRFRFSHLNIGPNPSRICAVVPAIQLPAIVRYIHDNLCLPAESVALQA